MVETVFQHDLTNEYSFGFSELSDAALDFGERRYSLNDSQLVSPYGHTMSPLIADLLDVAANIMWADRNCKRPRQYENFMAQRGWVRQFDLTIGVRHPEIWNDPVVNAALVELLTWLTEDIWMLRFQHQIVQKKKGIQPSLFSSPPTDALVVLYSGGLDSLAGTVALLQSDPHVNVVLMSAVSDRLSGVLKEQVRKLQSMFGVDRVQRALMPFHIARHNKGKEEATQRTRGFLFLCFGVAEAIACNASQVVTCENGIGALNLRLNRHQLGAQNTRAVHPKTLFLMNSLLALLGFGSIRCGAPHLLKTKGELCTSMKESRASSLCRTTISCDSFPLRISRPLEYEDAQLHCGLCTSCLFRRQSLFASGLQLEDAGTPYQYDLCRPLKTAYKSRLESLKFLSDQRYIIKQACLSSAPEAALMREFPELLSACQAVEQSPDIFGLSSLDTFMEELPRLFLRYVNEWKHFPIVLHTI